VKHVRKLNVKGIGRRAGDLQVGVVLRDRFSNVAHFYLLESVRLIAVSWLRKVMSGV
jgi:hypothetical protein